MSMKVLIVEDERDTANLLEEIINQSGAFQVIGVQDSVEGAVHFLKDKMAELDLLFLDIQLADGLSFQIFEQISCTIPSVFCTAYDAFMLKAFKHNGIDYILKPFVDEDVFAALNKVIQIKGLYSRDLKPLSEKILSALMSQKKDIPKSILVQRGQTMIPISVNQIHILHLEHETVRVYCSDNHQYALYRTLDDLQTQLDSAYFFRINRQMLINREAITAIQPYTNRKVLLKTRVPTRQDVIVSRLKVPAFMKWIEDPSA